MMGGNSELSKYVLSSNITCERYRWLIPEDSTAWENKNEYALFMYAED